jgi:serine/threonine protein kinase/WD40 repeat protein
MTRRMETPQGELVDRDERLGEAIEAYLALAEVGPPPEPEDFVARYPELGEELREALEGLALVRGLVGRPDGHGARLEAGRRIAGYRIVRELGRGGMGVVYEAVHVDLDRPVALKVLGMHAAPDSASRRRFLNEARTAAGLHHTHIVPVFDVGQVGGLCYYAMQRIEGSGLDRVLRRLRRDRVTAAGSATGSRWRLAGRAPTPVLPLGPDSTRSWSVAPSGGADLSGSQGLVSSPSRPAGSPADETAFHPPTGSAYYRWVADVGRQAAQALAHAHARGVIHRDIKPSNLLLDARGTTWVTDFGLARRLEDPGLTHSENRLGTPRYMSPEQAEGRPLDPRTDLYSLGATLYELLTLRPPFEGSSAAELTRQIVGRDPVALRSFDPRIPRDLETIVLKAMAKRPADRYATAQELADDLMRFLRFEPVKARRISPVGRAWRLARRHPTSSSVVTIATAVVLAVATWAYVRILAERDLARQAEHAKEIKRREAEQALAEAQRARTQAESALAGQYLRDATLVRLSTVPDRRSRGLSLLQKALDLDPAPDLLPLARNEAIELLLLRDVGNRRELPTGRLSGLAFSSQGDRLATLIEDGLAFRLWNVADPRLSQAQQLRRETTTTDFPLDSFLMRLGPRVALSGRRFAVLAAEGNQIRFFDAMTGEPAGDLPLNDQFAVALLTDPNGHRLVTVGRLRESNRISRNWSILLWDPTHPGEPLGLLEEPAETPESMMDPGPGRPYRGAPPGGRSGEPWPPLISFSPDGQTIATARMGESETEVYLWSAADGQPLLDPKTGNPLRVDTNSVLTALALGPSDLLATGGGGGLQLWDVRTLTALPPLSSHLNRIRLLRFSSDGWLAATGYGAGVELWDSSVGNLVAMLPTAGWVDDLAFSPSPTGRTLAAASGSSTVAWTIVDGLGMRRFGGFDAPPSSLAFGPEGRLAMASRRKPLRVWDMARCALKDREWPDVTSSQVCFTGDGRLAALDGGTLNWYQPTDGTAIGRIELPSPTGSRTGGRSRRFPGFPPILGMVRASDGNALALVRGYDILLWTADHQPDELVPLEIDPGPPSGTADPTAKGRDRNRLDLFWRSAVLGREGLCLYLIRGDETLHAFEREGRNTRPLGWATQTEVIGLALSPDDRTLALARRDGEVVLLDTHSGDVVDRWIPTAGEEAGIITAMAFSPVGNVLALGTSRGPVQLWRLESDRRATYLASLPGHNGVVSTLAFDDQGRDLASGGDDRSVVVWDLDVMNTELRRLGLDW